MIVEKEKIIELFSLKKSGTRGWMESLIGVPYCNKKQKLYIIFGEKTSSFECKSCLNHGSIYNLLKLVGRLDLIKSQKSFLPSSKIELLIENQIIEIKEEKEIILPEQIKPLGFYRIYENNYLEGRGFIKEHFEKLEIALSNIDPFVKNEYIIFILKDQNKRCIGWIARSIKDKDWIDNYNKTSEKEYLRWRNSFNTDFSKFLGGQDELIKEKTKTVIIVEGYTSKCNIDKLLHLYKSDEMKCVCSWGKKISLEQIKILEDNKIENVVLLYDTDAIKQSKTFSFDLFLFFNTKIGFIPFKNKNNKDKDPGDLNEEEIIYVFSNLETPVEFFSKINNKIKL